MAALAIASLVERLAAATPVKAKPSAEDDPARALLPIDGLFPQLFGQMVREKGEEGTETIAPALMEAVPATQSGTTGPQRTAAKPGDGLPIAMPVTLPMETGIPAAPQPTLVPPPAADQAFDLIKKSGPAASVTLAREPEDIARVATPGAVPLASALKAVNWTAPVSNSAVPEPVRAMEAVERQTPVDGPELRVVAATAPEPAKLAFTAQLSGPVAPPVTPLASPASAKGREERPAGENPTPADTSPRSSVNAKTAPEPVRATAAAARRPDGAPSHQDEPAPASTRTELHTLSIAQPQPETARVPERNAAPPEPTVKTHLEVPEPPKAPAPAREIRLAVSGGEQRVEVKLTERGGELQVAVRTADGHLADRLRENLPALTSRLVESGIRAETWHPPASGGEWRETKEASSASFADTSDPQPRQDGREQGREREPRQPPVVEETDQSRDKRKDFTWLMSTLR